MARNVEIKARIESVAAITPMVVGLADRGPIEILQDDTFFVCARGRLKLRALSPTEGQLIFFVKAPTTALSLAYGPAGRVRKHRTLYLVGRTRVHLDRVEQLGDFLELEVVLADGEPAEAGVAEAHRLMGSLGISPSQLVEGAYVDLLTRDG